MKIKTVHGQSQATVAPLICPVEVKELLRLVPARQLWRIEADNNPEKKGFSL